MKFSVPANSLIEGLNELRIWCPDNQTAAVKSIKITASKEAGILKDVFKPDGGLSGLALTETQNTTNNTTTTAVNEIIADMEDDGKLSPAEKVVWRSTFLGIEKAVGQAIAVADGLNVNHSALDTSYLFLRHLLVDAKVWSDPGKTSYLYSSTALSEAVMAYQEDYADLLDANTDQLAANLRQEAINKTESWSEEGANVTETHIANDTSNVNGTPADTVTSDLSTAKELSENATTTIAEMESDGILDTVEMATWRRNWSDFCTNYDAIVKKAIDRGLSHAALNSAKNALYSYLHNAGVFNPSSPPYTIIGTQLTDRTNAYYSAFKELDIACQNALQTFTTDWSEEGADVTKNNTANDTTNVNGTPAETVITTLDTANLNASTAKQAVHDMAADLVLTPSEKLTWRQNWPIMIANLAQYQTKYERLQSSSSVTTKYNIMVDSGVDLYMYTYNTLCIESAPNDNAELTLITVEGQTITRLEYYTKLYYDAVEAFLEECDKQEVTNGKQYTQDYVPTWWDAPNGGEVKTKDMLLNDKIAMDITNAKANGGALLDVNGLIKADFINANAIAVGPYDGWTYENTTYIDGGKIWTDTLTANAIKVGTITANEINGEAYIGGKRLDIAGEGTITFRRGGQQTIYHSLGRWAIVMVSSTGGGVGIHNQENYFILNGQDWDSNYTAHYVYM